MERKSWLIPYDILQEYLKTHKDLFKTQIREGKDHDQKEK
jgi:hypothetical protein